ncbi:MAG: integrase [Clostridia bacterium]|nr:integrase [Clostridia bacterium]
MDKNYFEDRDNRAIMRLRIIREDLPYFCDEFFVGIENYTSKLSRLNYAYDLRIFFDFLYKEIREFRSFTYESFSLEQLNKVNQTYIEQFLEYLNYYKFRGKYYKNNEKAKARKLSTIRSFFKYYFNKGKLNSNLASRVKVPKLHEKEIIRLEVNEVADLLDAVEAGTYLSEKQKSFHFYTKLRDTAIMTLLLGTGIRISECVGINIEDIDFRVNGFKVTRKGGNSSILYFSQEVAEALKEYLRERLPVESDTTALFLSLQNKRMNVRSIQLLVKKYSKDVTPLKKITPHKLRSTYGTNLYQETHDIYVVAEVLGHKDINTTKKHYAAISDDIKRQAANSVKLRDKKTDED